LEGPEELALDESHPVSDGKFDKDRTLERLMVVGIFRYTRHNKRITYLT